MEKAQKLGWRKRVTSCLKVTGTGQLHGSQRGCPGLPVSHTPCPLHLDCLFPAPEGRADQDGGASEEEPLSSGAQTPLISVHMHLSDV